MAGSRTPRIAINEDRAHQRREWRIERIGWKTVENDGKPSVVPRSGD